jgi:hypothetical protein
MGGDHSETGVVMRPGLGTEMTTTLAPAFRTEVGDHELLTQLGDQFGRWNHRKMGAFLAMDAHVSAAAGHISQGHHDANITRTSAE